MTKKQKLEKERWVCSRCTFENTTKIKCSACQFRRPTAFAASSSIIPTTLTPTTLLNTTSPVVISSSPATMPANASCSLKTAEATRTSTRVKRKPKHKYSESESEKDEKVTFLPHKTSQKQKKDSGDESEYDAHDGENIEGKKRKKSSKEQGPRRKRATKEKIAIPASLSASTPSIVPVPPPIPVPFSPLLPSIDSSLVKHKQVSTEVKINKKKPRKSTETLKNAFLEANRNHNSINSGFGNASVYVAPLYSSPLSNIRSSIYSSASAFPRYSHFAPTPLSSSSAVPYATPYSTFKRTNSSKDLALEEGRFGGGAVMSDRQNSSTRSSFSNNDGDEKEKAEEEDEDEILSVIRVKVKGLQYYAGIISKGEAALLQREPSNPYDKNAIRVLSILGAQVGHIEKEAASLLSPLFDAGKIVLEGTITTPPGTFSCSMDLTVWGNRADKELVNEKLLYCQKAKGCGGRSNSFSGGDGFKPRVSSQLMTQSVGSACDALMKDVHFSDTLQVLEPPSSCISPLYRHQKQALFWMSECERIKTDTIFWEQENPNSFFCRATSSRVKTQPLAMRGGILADDMGLGKTLTMLCLIARNKHGSSSSSDGFLKGPTLIICPLSVLGNWTQQAQAHFVPGTLKVSLYHGPTRNGKECEDSDIVLSTYETITSEYDPQNKTGWPFVRKWARIVIDEGQKICNRNAIRFHALCALDSQSRFVLSGTPIINKIEDFHALIAFLRLYPFSEYALFRRFIARPIKQNLVVGFSLLQRLVKCSTLRRTKSQKDPTTGQALINLPPKVCSVLTITLSPTEMQAYEVIVERARRLLRQFEAQGELMPRYSNVLEALLRLRQCCCDLNLLGIEGWSPDSNLSPDVIKRLSLFVDELEKADAKVAEEECCICFTLFNDPLITKCGHMFCEPCVDRLLQSNTGSAPCPLCRALLQRGELMSFSAVKTIVHKNDSSDGSTKKLLQPSSKQQVLLSRLQAEPHEKALVISQWTELLDNTGRILEANNVKCVKLDGRNTRVQRDNAIDEFMSPSPSSPQVMLLSLKAGGLGLNLTRATRVYILDPWWNLASEEQAIDRVYRLGQTKQVAVFRLVAKATLEPRILELQQRKNDLMQGAFASKTAGELAKQRLSDLKSLLAF